MITLFTADCRQNAKNCLYPHRVEVEDEAGLRKAVSTDYTCACFAGGRRSIESFQWSDCLAFDCDNDHSDLPSEWIEPKDVANAFPGVEFAVHYSRNHRREKNGREARPRFHVLFPIERCENAEEYAGLKRMVQRRFPYFDEQAMDAARFFFGTGEPEVEYWGGVRNLTEYLKKLGVIEGKEPREKCTASCAGDGITPRDDSLLRALNNDDCNENLGEAENRLRVGDLIRQPCGLPPSPERGRPDGKALPGDIMPFSPIPKGERNATMHRFAVKTMKRYGVSDRAKELYLREAERCDPPLEPRELVTIWRSAAKFYQERIAPSPDYVPPDLFGRPGDSLKPDDYSDLGEAKVLVREYREELVYTDATDYLRYDGTCWEESKQLAVGAMEEFLDLQLADAEDEVARVLEIIRSLGVVEFTLGDGVKALEGESKKLQKDGENEKVAALEKAKNMLASALQYHAFVMRRRDMNYILSTLAAAKPVLRKRVTDLDGDEFLLNTPSATYDLRCGLAGVMAHDPRHYITKVTAVDPSEKGRDIWEDALNTFFCGDRELIEYVQQIAGLAAIGKIFIEAILIAYGEGRNGKSTFWNTISRVLGSYSGQISADTLTVGVKRNVKPEMAELKGKRMVIAAELEEGMRLNTSVIKQLCSTDEIFAEKKYKDPFRFKPSHTLVLYTNHLPKVGASDAGTWRRLIVIPFHAKIEGKSDIKNYTDHLVKNAGEAVLQWIIEGAQKVIAHDFQLELPECVKKAIKAYRDSNDWLNNFLDECCEMNKGFKERSGNVYQAYRSLCARNGEWARGTTDFYAAMEAAGFEKRRMKDCRYLIGLRLKPEALEVLP